MIRDGSLGQEIVIAKGRHRPRLQLVFLVEHSLNMIVAPILTYLIRSRLELVNSKEYLIS